MQKLFGVSENTCIEAVKNGESYNNVLIYPVLHLKQWNLLPSSKVREHLKILVCCLGKFLKLKILNWPLVCLT